MYNNAFDGSAWHGSSIITILNRVKGEHLVQDLQYCRRIAKVVHHMLIWRAFSLHILKGGNVYDVAEEDNWKDFDTLTEEIWQDLKSKLIDSQKELNSILQEMKDEQLDEKVLGKQYDIYILLHGMIQHDLYHLGEITSITQKLK